MSSSPERTRATRKAFSRAFRQYGNSDAECASSVRRLFGQALLGYGVEDRTRYVSDFGTTKRLDTTAHAVSLGASLGIGRKFEPEQLSLSLMPYAQLSWDGINRDSIRESDSLVAQEFDNELLSVVALEAGLAFKTRNSAAPTGNVSFEGRLAYRNRFHIDGNETYT